MSADGGSRGGEDDDDVDYDVRLLHNRLRPWSRRLDGLKAKLEQALMRGAAGGMVATLGLTGASGADPAVAGLTALPFTLFVAAAACQILGWLFSSNATALAMMRIIADQPPPQRKIPGWIAIMSRGEGLAGTFSLALMLFAWAALAVGVITGILGVWRLAAA